MMLLTLVWFILIVELSVISYAKDDEDYVIKEKLRLNQNSQDSISGLPSGTINRRGNSESRFVLKSGITQSAKQLQSSKGSINSQNKHPKESPSNKKTVSKDLPHFAKYSMDKSFNAQSSLDENRFQFPVLPTFGTIFTIFLISMVLINIPFICAFRALQQYNSSQIRHKNKVVNDFHV